MEVGGFTGDRLWLLAAVVFFNLGCVLLWFVVGVLRRGQDGALREGRVFVALMRREAERTRLGLGRRGELEDALRGAEAHFGEGERLGPLWGRRAITLGTMDLHGVADRFPELAGPVNAAMLDRGGDEPDA